MTPVQRVDTRVNEPRSRLARIAATAMDAVRAHPEHRPADRAWILLNNPETREATNAHTSAGDPDGQTEDREAAADTLADLLTHVEGAFAAHGIPLTIIPVPTPGQG